MFDDEYLSDSEFRARAAEQAPCRRCPIHPDVKVSSFDLQFDAPCWKCEMGDDDVVLPDDPFGNLWAGTSRLSPARPSYMGGR